MELPIVDIDRNPLRTCLCLLITVPSFPVWSGETQRPKQGLHGDTNAWCERLPGNYEGLLTLHDYIVD